MTATRPAAEDPRCAESAHSSGKSLVCAGSSSTASEHLERNGAKPVATTSNLCADLWQLLGPPLRLSLRLLPPRTRGPRSRLPAPVLPSRARARSCAADMIGTECGAGERRERSALLSRPAAGLCGGKSPVHSRVPLARGLQGAQQLLLGAGGGRQAPGDSREGTPGRSVRMAAMSDAADAYREFLERKRPRPRVVGQFAANRSKRHDGPSKPRSQLRSGPEGESIPSIYASPLPTVSAKAKSAPLSYAHAFARQNPANWSGSTRTSMIA